MNYQKEWKLITSRFQAFLQSSGILFSSMNHNPENFSSYLISETSRIWNQILNFCSQFKNILPPEATTYFFNEFQKSAEASNFKTRLAHKDLGALQANTATLVCLFNELNYYLTDFSYYAKRLTERAFFHLQRCIIVDGELKKRWLNAFRKHETQCEKLGSVHLLLHGIWAFKIDGQGERTDLVLSEPFKEDDISQAERSAEALVLTEWKKVKNQAELQSKAHEAFKQAEIYSGGILRGLELKDYRYIVLVSEKNLSLNSLQLM